MPDADKPQVDPTKKLAEQIATATSILADIENDTIEAEQLEADAASLAHAVLALHEWIQAGGLLPDQWQPHSEFSEADPTLADMDGELR